MNTENQLFEAARSMAPADRDRLIEGLLQTLPPLSLESLDVLELKAQELASYHAWCRMPPALRCAFCDKRMGALPEPAGRFAPFDVLRLGQAVMVAGRYGMFLCADCISGAWSALQENGGST